MNTKDLEKVLNEEMVEDQANDEILLLSEAAKRKEQGTNFNRYPTGLIFLDDVAKLRDEDQGGLAGGDLVIISAPTGNGKTTLAATISFSMFKHQGIPSLWFTYEISTYALWKVFERMGALPQDFFVVPADHTTGKLEWIEKKIIEAKEKFMVGVVVIDHLGFLAPFQKMNDNMTQNYSSYLGQICRELKTIAVRENITIILPVHMVKSATDDPSLRDIGHSGGIAQEADFVLLMAREEEQKSRLSSLMMSDYYTAYTKVMLAKNRIGGKTPSWWMKLEGGQLVTTIKESNPQSKWDEKLNS